MSAEVQRTHTRLLKCALEVDDARAYWRRNPTPHPHPSQSEARALANTAFTEFWFGDKSLPRVQVLLQNFRARFDAFPDALALLHAWSTHAPDSLAASAALICHWHTQLTDPIYRAFTLFLAARRDGPNPTVTRDVALTWLGTQPDSAPWTMSTRIQFASKLLSTAYAAGLVTTNHDRAPRPLAAPRVPPRALGYLLHLLRTVDTFTGTLLDNPYLTSVGLTDTLEPRLRQLADTLAFRRQADLIDLTFHHPDLERWGTAVLRPTL